MSTTHHGHLSPQLHPLGGVPSSGRDHILKSISYRRRRAKQRKIFLTTYKLDSFTEPESPKLNNVALKFKKIVASVLKLVQTKAAYVPKRYESLENPFAHKPPRKRSRCGSGFCGCLRCCCCCFSFCRCCICTIFIIIILLVGIGLALFYFIKPKVPSYDIEHINVKSFDIRKESKVYTDVVIVVKADNPNEEIGLDYLENEVGIMYVGSQLSSGQIPPFLQPGKNTTTVNVELKGENEFSVEMQNHFMEDQEKGNIPLLITVKLPIRIVINDLIHLRKVVVNLNCSVVIDKLEVNKSPKILDKVFSYGIEF
ncbi:NDR1/HIN1-like protein 6 [Glycine soja]